MEQFSKGLFKTTCARITDLSRQSTQGLLGANRIGKRSGQNSLTIYSLSIILHCMLDTGTYFWKHTKILMIIRFFKNYFFIGSKINISVLYLG